MSSIFTKIINGDIPSHKIAEDENHYAFLDINPLAEGHTLVVPKKEVDYIFDLDTEDLQALHAFAAKVAKALETKIECKRVGVLVIGTEVPHAHIHLIPFQKESQMAITSPKMSLSQERMKEIAEVISSSYNKMNPSSATLVFGASVKPERYSNMAIKMLKEYDHEVIGIGGRSGETHGVEILKGHPPLIGVHTISMYMGADRQAEHEEYLLSLKPKRIIFNPGAENISLYKKAKEQGIEVMNECTLVMLRSQQF